MKRRVRVSAVAGMIAVSILGALPGLASATNFSYWNGHYATESPENVGCVAASALTWRNQIYGFTDDYYYNHATMVSWYNEGRSHTKYTYSAGLDPRAWAWLLWKHTPYSPAYSFHDYKWSSQSNADGYMMGAMRFSGKPVGALVDHGFHAVDVVGFNSNTDPGGIPTTLLGFYIVDPYYGGSNTRKAFHGGYIGESPNTYIALATWNSTYFTTYNSDSFTTIWTNNYVAVLRSANGSPEPTTLYDTEPPKYGYGSSSVAALTPTPNPAYGDISTATLAGITSNQLTDSLGLGSAKVGNSIHVESLSDAAPSYELVEVKVGGQVKAIAMLQDLPDGLHFGALQTVGAGAHIPSQAEGKARMTAKGLAATSAKAVWSWTAESSSPFDPFWTGADSGGHSAFLGSDDQLHSTIHLSAPRGH